MEKKTANPEMSLSKQRKLAKAKEIERQKKQKVINKIILAAVAVLIIALIVWGVLSAKAKKARSVTANGDYSAELNDDGTIKDITASDYITVADYTNIEVDNSTLEYTDSEVDSDIADLIEEYTELDDTATVAAALGDKVNIDFVGTINGEEFEGGTDSDYDLELGSGTFPDAFEEQLVGHVSGDTFEVEVTFPEDYEADETLAGCDVVYTVTLNGVYVVPEFNDAFVAENLSDYASTAEEYRQYLKDTNYESNLKGYVRDYLVDNSTLISYPEAYLKQLKSNYKYYEYSNYEYMDSLYTAYYGASIYTDFADYISQSYSMTEEEYDASLQDAVTENITYTLACQAIAEAEGISATYEDALEAYIADGNTESSFTSLVETYGTGYAVQQALCAKVVEFICSQVNAQ